MRPASSLPKSGFPRAISRTLVAACLLLASGCEPSRPPDAEDPWRRFTDALARAGEIVERGPQDELTRAEGHRYLARLIGEGVKTTVDFEDASRPRVAAKLFSGGDTSDARYYDAHIDGGRSYRLTGRRGTAPLIEFTVYDGKIGLDDRSAQIAHLTERELVLEGDESFEIHLSPDPPGDEVKNWIRTTPETDYLFIRQYAHDWRTTHGASFHIESLDPEDPGPALDEEEISRRLLATASFVEKLASHWAKTVDMIRWLPANRLVVVPDSVGDSMPAGHRFAAGEFELEPDEVLIVEFAPSPAPYWGFQLTNYWFEPIDYGGIGSHVNNRSAHLEEDGSMRLVISNADPRACNWLETREHRIGTMQFRLSRAGKDEMPSFRMRVVKLEEVEPSEGCSRASIQ